MIKNVVDAYSWLDAGLDIYFKRVVFWDKKINGFIVEDFREGTEPKLIFASQEIKKKYENIKKEEEEKNKSVFAYFDAIVKFRCPICNKKLYLVKNNRFLWLLHKRCNLPAPYNIQIKPKGSVAKQYFVTWCKSCGLNFTLRNYHRSSELKIIKNTKVIKVLSVYCGMDKIRTEIYDKHIHDGRYCELCGDWINDK